MKTLYIDCGMGAAGDMLTAALLELIPSRDAFIAEVNSVGIPDVVIRADSAGKCGIRGTHITVTVGGEEESEHHHEHHHHHHSGIDDIAHIVSQLSLSDKVKSDIMAIYTLIGEAESHAHGVPVTDIHFHEVGTMDAIADITSVCMLMEKIAPKRIIVSPVHVGCGHVKCAHGILPVPAPATAHILRGVPIYGGNIEGELCTPTGAAILKYFASDFGAMPVMNVSAIGYGMGSKDFAAANCVRLLLGEAESCADTVTELSCNLDDMTPESVGYAMDCLFKAGALDVYTVPVGMKKSRLGTLLCVLCDLEHRDDIVQKLFRHTTTLGIRESVSRRYVLNRRTETVATELGNIRKKVSTGFGVTREKAEYEDIARVASANDMSIAEVLRSIEK